MNSARHGSPSLSFEWYSVSFGSDLDGKAELGVGRSSMYAGSDLGRKANLGADPPDPLDIVFRARVRAESTWTFVNICALRAAGPNFEAAMGNSRTDILGRAAL